MCVCVRVCVCVSVCVCVCVCVCTVCACDCMGLEGGGDGICLEAWGKIRTRPRPAFWLNISAGRKVSMSSLEKQLFSGGHYMARPFVWHTLTCFRFQTMGKWVFVSCYVSINS